MLAAWTELYEADVVARIFSDTGPVWELCCLSRVDLFQHDVANFRRHEVLVMFAGISDREEDRQRHGGVAAWRSDVKTFFQNDWEKLRNLILRMEEQSWGSSRIPEQKDHQESLRPVSAMRHSRQSEPTKNSVPEVREPVQEVPRQNRLAELADRIEQRIRAVNTRSHET